MFRPDYIDGGAPKAAPEPMPTPRGDRWPRDIEDLKVAYRWVLAVLLTPTILVTVAVGLDGKLTHQPDDTRPVCPLSDHPHMIYVGDSHFAWPSSHQQDTYMIKRLVARLGHLCPDSTADAAR